MYYQYSHALFQTLNTYTASPFIGSGNTTLSKSSIFGSCSFQSVSGASYPSGSKSLIVNGYQYTCTCNHGSWTEIWFKLPNEYYYVTHSMYITGTRWSNRTNAYFTNIPYSTHTVLDEYAYAVRAPAYYAYTPPVYAYTAQKVYQPLIYRYQTI